MTGPRHIPYMVVYNPTCSDCWGEVDHDGDNYVCETCRVYWDEGAGDGDQATYDLDTQELLKKD